MKDQYAEYLRKSRADLEDEAQGKEDTLIRHERILLELAKKHKLNVTAIFKEVVSGETIASRPVMQQLLSEVESGKYKGVLVVEVERLARGDTMDQGLVAQTFKYSNTKIITPTKTYDPNDEFDEEYFEFGLFMSRREYKTINRRLQRGRISSVNEGKYVGNKPPYGYVRVKLEKEKGFTLKPDTEQAKVVKLIYQLFTEGEKQEDGSYKRLGTSLIARKLNDLEIKPMYGDMWVWWSILGILTNPVYMGKIRWNRRPTVKKMVDGKITKSRPVSDNVIIVDGLHEAIVSEETYNLAQCIFESNQTRVKNNKGLTNPFAGLIICGKCGRHMQLRPKGVRTPYDTLVCPAGACKNVSSRFESVENKILLSLEGILNEFVINLDKKYVNNNNSEINVIEQKLQQCNNELAEAKKQLNTIYDSYEKGIYSSDIFVERSKILSERINDLQNAIKKLEHQQEKVSGNIDNTEYIIPMITQILDTYHKLPTAQAKNDLMKKVIKSITYTKERSGAWKDVDPDDYTLDFSLKLK